ncbi:MAG: 50S ribosomal protein L25, partial [Thermodesulfovibrionales bacterium]|nr:50S ribosomal protein L25 [Thermodesulfovibrionales bacterium]
MEIYTLKAEKRTTAGKGVARKLRRNGFIPAIIYRGGNSVPIQLPTKEVVQLMHKTAGEQVLVNIVLNGEVKQALIKDYQVDPVSGNLLHVDFQEILTTEKIRVMVHIVIGGEPIGVKSGNGILQYGLREVEVECLPTNIPGHIDVDVSHLDIGQSIHVGDLNLGENIRILTDPDELIATVTALKEEIVSAEPVSETVAVSYTHL